MVGRTGLIRGAVVGMTAAVLVLAPLAAQAQSRSEDPAPTTAGYTQNLPYTSTLTAIGQGGQASSTLPIPVGLTPSTLSGTVTATAASSGEAIISVGTAQTQISVRQGGSFTLTLPAGTLVNSAVTVTMANQLDPKVNETCSYDTTTTVTLSNIQIVATGTETPPTTVAEFFSPAVRSIWVAAPDTLNASVNEAVLAAVGSLSAKYGRDTAITAGVAADMATTFTPGARVVLVKATSDSAVTVAVSNANVPTLTISGPANLLTAATAALGSPTLGLAGAPTVSQLAQTTTAAPGTAFTLADFGTAQPTLIGVGRLTYSTTVSQSRFGGPMSSFSVHIVGGNTPTPAGGIVTASILWNDLIVNSQSIASTDNYVADITIDSSLVKRDNTLTVRLEAAPPGGYCTTTPIPAELDINGAGSTITGHPGQTLPAGFQRFPQVLGTQLPIAFGSTAVTASMLSSAAHMVSTLQRASVPQLAVRLEDIATFEKGSYPGLVVGATPADADALKAPLRYQPWRAVDALGKNVTVTVASSFAALEAFDAQGRNIAMVGSTTPTSAGEPLMDSVTSQADANPFGWFVLTGDLLVAQPGLPNLALTSATIVPQAVIANEFTIPPWLIIAVAVVIIIVVARMIALSRRRRRIENDVQP